MGFVKIGRSTVWRDEGFKESDHPRAKDGKFGSGGGSGESKAESKPAEAKAEKKYASEYHKELAEKYPEAEKLLEGASNPQDLGKATKAYNKAMDNDAEPCNPGIWKNLMAIHKDRVRQLGSGSGKAQTQAERIEAHLKDVNRSKRLH